MEKVVKKNNKLKIISIILIIVMSTMGMLALKSNKIIKSVSKIPNLITASTGIPYKIEYYHQNLSLDEYELVKTEILYGEKDTQVTAKERNFAKFKENKEHSDRVITGIIAEDGSLVLKRYYDRIKIDTNTLYEFSQISAGYNHSMAIDKNGNLWTWGTNSSGQLGNGGKTMAYEPEKIMTETTFKKISAGGNHSLAIDSEGNLWTWGYNIRGQLGNGTTENSQIPIHIMPEIKFKEVSAGNIHSMAIDEKGNLWTWGYNASGELGNGETTNLSEPIKVMRGITLKQISAGYNHNMALDSEGNLWTWGNNFYGQLGNGTNSSSLEPIQIMEGTTFIQISAGNKQSRALDSKGNLWIWGGGTKTPTKLKSGIKEISTGNDHSLAIDEQGNLWTWGSNNNGQLGDETINSSQEPIKIMEETTFTQISAGYDHSMALDSEGNLWTWGDNNNGQLGDKTTTNSLIPIPIVTTIEKEQVKDIKGLKAGAYIKYDTGVNSVGDNGVITCIVLYDYTSEYGVQIISKDIVSKVKLGSTDFNTSKNSYNNAILTLNTQARKYLNPKYASDARSVGSYPDEPYREKSNYYETKYDYASSLNRLFKDGDSNNTTDKRQMYKLGIANIKDTYWLANRFVRAGSNLTAFGIEYIRNATDIVYYDVCGINAPNSGNNKYSYEYKFGLRPCFTLNTDLKIMSGDGKTEETAYTFTGTPYKVEHYQQKLTKDEYELIETEELKGTAGEEVTATSKEYKGFTENEKHEERIPTGTITEDGNLVLKLYYDRNKYKITLVLDEGNREIEYVHGENVTLPTDITRPGYTFKGWYDNEELTGDPVTIIGADETEDKEYYAKWEINQYTVTFKDEEIEETQTVSHGSDATEPTWTKKGHTLTWDRDFTNVTENITVNAIWTKDKYTVTLNTNGGIINSGNIENYTYGTEETLPTDITRPGYTFKGWYDNEELTGDPVTKISVSETGDKTYFAKWEEKINIIVNKVWRDTEEQRVHRPENIEIQLKNGESIIDTKIIPNTQTEIRFEELTKCDSNGNEIIYTIAEEQTSKFYVSSIDQETRTVTNTFTVPDEKVSLQITKNWVDTEEQRVHRPENIKLQLKTNGENSGEEVTVTGEGNTWNYTFENLAKYDENGNEITYTAEETSTNKFYVMTQEGNTITNTFTVPDETIDLTVNKVWVDTEEQKAHRPESIKIQVMNEETLADEKELSNTETETTFTLPKYDTNGNETVYTIAEEQNSKFYTSSINQETRTVTNTFIVPEETVSLTVTKIWLDNSNDTGKRPQSVIIVAKSENIEVGQVELTVADALEGYTNTWQGQIANLQKYDSNGNEIVYTIDEKEINVGDLNFYTKSIDQETKTITNRSNELKAKYKVEHYLRSTDLEVESYVLKETENLEGIVGTLVTAIPKKYIGFTEDTNSIKRIPEGIVLEDGSLVLKLYYERNIYKVTLNTNEGIITNGNVESYIYGIEETLPIKVEKQWYTFAGWYDNPEFTGEPITKINAGEIGDKTYYAKWTDEDYYITSPVYNINTEENYITKVSPYTNLTTFLNNIKTNGIPKVVDLNGKEITSETLVGTGYKLQVTYKDKVYEYDIAVRGDLDGNGIITVTDLSVMNKVIVGSKTLTRIEEKAADIDYNNEIIITDLSMLNQTLVGKLTL